MKSDWDALMAEYAGAKGSGVYDVDCTAAGKDLCEEVGVQGYPTIKYGDPSDKKALQAYEGGRDGESLKKFAEENLAPVCGPASFEACSEEEKVMLGGFMTKSSADLSAEAKKLAKDFAAKSKKLAKKSSKMSEKSQEFLEDEAEQKRAKPKKGKEAAHRPSLTR